MSTRPDGLMCDHCGGEAIQFKPPAHPGHFWHLFDGDGDRCDECGFPGHVSVDDGGYEEDSTARWAMSDWDDDAKCARAECEECHQKEK